MVLVLEVDNGLLLRQLWLLFKEKEQIMEEGNSIVP